MSSRSARQSAEISPVPRLARRASGAPKPAGGRRSTHGLVAGAARNKAQLDGVAAAMRQSCRGLKGGTGPPAGSTWRFRCSQAERMQRQQL